MRVAAGRRINVELVARAFGALAVLIAAAMMAAVPLGQPQVVTAAAWAFALSSVLAAILSNVAAWCGTPPTETASALVAAGRSSANARLAAIAYTWGAISMQGLYLTPVTGLKWQHGWQYALAMALLAAASWAYARGPLPATSGRHPGNWTADRRLPALLAVGQALVAAIGLAVLVVGGKMWSVRADWAANRVFAALAAAILVISLATMVSLRSPMPRKTL